MSKVEEVIMETYVVFWGSMGFNQENIEATDKNDAEEKFRKKYPERAFSHAINIKYLT